MTEEQIQELKNLDLPYCPSAFDYVGGKFGKYKAYIKLAAFRVFGFARSAELETSMSKYWRKYKND
jgi:hypothetical protein